MIQRRNKLEYINSNLVQSDNVSISSHHLDLFFHGKSPRYIVLRDPVLSDSYTMIQLFESRLNRQFDLLSIRFPHTNHLEI